MKDVKISVTHFEWEENGKKYSATKIGGAIVGDAAMSEIEEIMKEEFKHTPKLLTPKNNP